MNRIDPAKAIHIPRGATTLPKGVKSCTINVKGLSPGEKRILHDEMMGKSPEWTWNGVCYRPNGSWHNTKSGGMYVTENVQEMPTWKRKIMREQTVCFMSVLTDEVHRFTGVTICDIVHEAGQKFGKLKSRGHNIPVVYDDEVDDEWVAYI